MSKFGVNMCISPAKIDITVFGNSITDGNTMIPTLVPEVFLDFPRMREPRSDSRLPLRGSLMRGKLRKTSGTRVDDSSRQIKYSDVRLKQNSMQSYS